MLLRFLLACLLAIVATPAAAMPVHCHASGPVMAVTHGPQAGAATHGRHHRPAPEPLTAQHGCIGCVPIGDGRQPAITPTAMPAAPAAVATVRTLDPGRRPAPVLPPPREN